MLKSITQQKINLVQSILCFENYFININLSKLSIIWNIFILLNYGWIVEWTTSIDIVVAPLIEYVYCLYYLI